MTVIDVYLVPIGSAGHELFCEAAEVADLHPADAAAPGGLYARFRAMMAEARESRRARRLAAVPTDPEVQQPWLIRVRNFVVGKVAEAIAEWRLLWHLRKQTTVTLVHPSDLDAARACAEMRARLERDRDRHRRRLIATALTGAVLGPLFFFVPGPNLIAYYFWFLAVGHLLAWRGARQGLGAVEWQTRSSDDLVALRGLLELDPGARATHVREVAARLGLEHLAAFVERVSVRAR